MSFNNGRSTLPDGALRIAVIKKYGGKCSRCGYSDWRALQIDHVNGGGVQHRQAYGTAQLQRLTIRAFGSGKYELLCANCNWIKRHENSEGGRLSLNEVLLKEMNNFFDKEDQNSKGVLATDMEGLPLSEVAVS